MAGFGDVNSYRPIPVGVCTNATTSHGYSLLTSLDYNIYAFLTGCSDISCSQCNNAITLSLDVCAPDAKNTSYSYLLTGEQCWLAQTNPATITTGSVSMIFTNDTEVCLNSTNFDVVNFGILTSNNPVCVPVGNNGYAVLLTYNSNGTYSGGVQCNLNCSLCNDAFWSLPVDTCEVGSQAGTSFGVVTTSNLWTCYAPPVTMYLAHVFDP